MGTKKSTKYDAVKQYLLNGNSISSLEAINMFHATRLSVIIHTLRHRDNITIHSSTEQSPDGACYARYWVDPKELELNRHVDEAQA